MKINKFLFLILPTLVITTKAEADNSEMLSSASMLRNVVIDRDTGETVSYKEPSPPATLNEFISRLGQIKQRKEKALQVKNAILAQFDQEIASPNNKWAGESEDAKMKIRENMTYSIDSELRNLEETQKDMEKGLATLKAEQEGLEADLKAEADRDQAKQAVEKALQDLVDESWSKWMQRIRPVNRRWSSK